MSDETTEASLEKVREILFGTEKRASEKRLQKMENRFAREVSAIQQRLTKRVDALEELMNHELDVLTQMVKDEAAERAAGDKAATVHANELSRGLDKKLREAEAQSGRGLRELRGDLQQQAKAIRAELEERCAELGEVLDGEVEELRETKVDKEKIAQLLSALAAELVGGAKK